MKQLIKYGEKQGKYQYLEKTSDGTIRICFACGIYETHNPKYLEQFESLKPGVYDLNDYSNSTITPAEFPERDRHSLSNLPKKELSGCLKQLKAIQYEQTNPVVMLIATSRFLRLAGYCNLTQQAGKVTFEGRGRYYEPYGINILIKILSALSGNIQISTVRLDSSSVVLLLSDKHSRCILMPFKKTGRAK